MIDFVANISNLSGKTQLKNCEVSCNHLIKIQSCNKTKDYPKSNQKKQTLDQFFHEQQIRFFQYTVSTTILQKWKVDYAPKLKMMIGIRYLLKQWKNTHLLNTRWMCFLVVRSEDHSKIDFVFVQEE